MRLEGRNHCQNPNNFLISGMEMLRNYHLGFYTKYYLAILAITFLLWVLGLLYSLFPFIGMPALLPPIYFMIGKIIKYKIVDTDIVVVAFGFFILERIAMKDIVKVNGAPAIIINPFTIARQGHTRRRWILNSFTEEKKLIKLNSGITIIISPEHGSEIDLLLSNLKTL